MAKISTIKVLEQIGFKQISNSKTSLFTSDYGLEFNFGNFKLRAFEGVNRYLMNVLIFSGVNNTIRTLSEIHFELPLEVESYEQGIAFISYYLGRGFQASIIPEWYYQGLQFKNLLPWEKELEAFRQNPSASIEHDYFKLIIRKMIKISSTAKEDDVTTFSFDGEILRIICADETIIAPATGKAWNEDASVKTQSLSFLPKRIKYRNGHDIYLWGKKIHIDNRVFTPINSLQSNINMNKTNDAVVDIDLFDQSVL